MASETHTETGANPAEHGSSFPPFDDTTFASQIFWLVLCFGILYFVMSKFGLPRVGGIIEARQQKLSNDIETAHRLQSEADDVKVSYEQALADARRNAQETALAARDKAKAEINAERQKAEDALQAKMTEAEQRISDMKSKAMENVSSIAEDVASEMSSSLLNVKVSKADLTKAVSSAMKG